MTSTKDSFTLGKNAVKKRQSHLTFCYMCAVKCSRKVTVEDGKIIDVGTEWESGLPTEWCPSMKGKSAVEIYDHPDRLMYPQKRAGARGEGKWQRISWDEALDTIARKLNDIKAKYGPEYVALCLGEPKGLEFHFGHRFATTFGTPNVVTPGNVCDDLHPADKYTYGGRLRHDTQAKPGLIVLWANDLINTVVNGMQRDVFKAALMSGAKLVVIDVKKIDIAKRADLWIRPRPGSDGALAMGIIKVMIEEKLYDEDFVANWTVGFDKLCGEVKNFTLDDVETVTWVPREQIQEFARLFMESQPATIQKGNAVDQHINSFQLCRAIDIIRALSGKVNTPGADIFYSPGVPIMPLGRFVFPRDVQTHRDMSKVLGPEYQLSVKGNYISREVLIKTILEEKPYPIKAVLFLLTDPLVSYTNTEEVYRAFMKLDFIAGADIFPSPTTAIADIVLPAAWGAEMEMATASYQAMPKIIDPPGEAWPDCKWINELGKKMGMQGWFDNYEEVLDLMVKPAGLTWEDLKQKRFIPFKAEYAEPEDGAFKTPSGKAEIYSEQLIELGYSPMPTWKEMSSFRFNISDEYPLIMTNDKEEAYYLTGYKHVASLRKHTPQPTVELHPETAEKLGLTEGEWVYIETKTGKIQQILELNPDLDPRVVVAAFGWWFPEEPEDLFQFRKSNINVLTDSDPPHDPAISTPELRAIPCRLYKV